MNRLFNGWAQESDTWTVTELSNYLRELFEIDFRLQDIRIKGEISNFTRAASGHLYFTLKDEDTQIKGVMWRSSASKLVALPEEGDSVIAHGKVSVYEAGGVYQLYADSLTPVGKGDLALEFERLKKRLLAEGLFDDSYKKAIPAYPQKIGVVTSADAAALRDILNVTRRRWPVVSVLVVPTLVQGNEAPGQIVSALRWVDGRNDIDTIILARGGGSIEDLAAFNDENVARTIFELRHPIIVGVGHETDFTISDFVADLRAPTPSAAAELAVPDLEEVKNLIERQSTAMKGSVKKKVMDLGMALFGLSRSLSQVSPIRQIQNALQQVNWFSIRLDSAIGKSIDIKRSRLAVVTTTLQSVGPVATLERGYAIVQKQDKQIVRSVDDVTSDDLIDIMVTDGTFGAVVKKGSSYVRNE